MCVLASSILILPLAVIGVAQGPGAQPKLRNDPGQQGEVIAKIMAKKLHHTQQLIAALAVEDFARLANDARELKLIGEATLLKVSPELDYVKYCGEFTAIADELARRAKDHDLNGSTLSYVRLTINCVECHKHVRDRHVLDRNR
jgi:hypothetical protein